MADAIPPVNTTTPAANPYYTPPKGAAAPGTVNKNMFLQLLVAQLRHQDPMKPSDGAEFVGQLAQFEQLEQSTNTGQDIAAIRADLDVLAGANKT
jgi:flagellar basal-body rod modification protein FlgD